MRIGTVLICGMAAVGCAPRVEVAPVSDVSSVSIDTVRGEVELSGSLPLAQLILRWGAGPGDAVALSGPAVESLVGLTGLEVMVRGQFGDVVVGASPAGLRGFVAGGFVVRAGDNGAPAHDGVVAHRDGSWFLVGEGGALMPAPFLPDALRHQEGARVYLLGPLDAPPVGYGVVRAR